MSNDINKPTPNLRTPMRSTTWTPWIAILAVILVEALAWNFWPHASVIKSDVPPAKTNTTQAPATAAPATTPTQQ